MRRCHSDLSRRISALFGKPDGMGDPCACSQSARAVTQTQELSVAEEDGESKEKATPRRLGTRGPQFAPREVSVYDPYLGLALAGLLAYAWLKWDEVRFGFIIYRPFSFRWWLNLVKAIAVVVAIVIIVVLLCKVHFGGETGN